jgi:TP901 family phage tail tape measure protein
VAAMRSVGVKLRLYTDDYRRDAAVAARATDDIGDSGKRTKKSLADMADGMAIAGGILAAAVGVVVVATAKFDKQMSEVAAVTGATADEMDALRESALAAGAATAFSASEAAQAQAELAKAGVLTADILGGALSGSLSLAAAGTLDLATAATIAAQAMNIFGLGGQDVEHIADVLAAGANKSATSVEELGIGLQQVGLVAKQVGFGLEETIGLLAAFADNALGGSDGATSLKTALLRLAAPLPEAERVMKQFGISLYDTNGQMVDAVTIAGQLRDGLGDLSAAEKNAALMAIFGQDAIRAGNVLIAEGAEGIRKYINAVDDQGAAARVAGMKMDNLAGDVEELTGSLETLFITSGSGASSGLRGLTQGATELVNIVGSLPAPVLSAGVVVAGLTGVTLLAAAAFLKAQAGLASLNAQLALTGPLGTKAAAGLRVLTAAAGPVGAVLTGIGLSYSHWADRLKEDKPLSNLEKLAHILTTTPLGTAAWNAMFPPEITGKRMDDVTIAAHEAAEATASVTQNNIALAGAFGEAASEADGLLNAFTKLNGATLGSRDATRDAEAAVDDLQEALEESNGSLDITTEEGRAAEAALDALAAAAANAAQKKYEETGSVEQANAAYQNYIGQLRQTLLNSGMAEDAVDALISKIAQMPTYKAITLDVGVQLRIASAPGFGMAAFSQLAKGGIHAAATGRLDGAVVDSPTVLFGERSTVKEAFIPQEGISQGRAMSILGEAASWHGAQVIPEGGYHSGMSTAGPQAVDVRVTIAGSDSQVKQAVADLLRVDVVQFGGGSVQDNYGARGRVG